ncbi:5-methylaminomethyl-2-thiouridine methyltransferase [Vibrio cholerae]|nr:5-methylaminomethyl-2-thiouridine methyltransferase [Vibrio cholerae]
MTQLMWDEKATDKLKSMLEGNFPKPQSYHLAK